MQLISAYVFATQIVQTLNFLNLKFQASSHLLWQKSGWFVSDLVGNPEDRFSRHASQFMCITDDNLCHFSVCPFILAT